MITTPAATHRLRAASANPAAMIAEPT